VPDSVERTSETLCDRVRVVKIEAKASSVTVLGNGEVTEIGRCSEKKAEAATSV
jgi:hypothetical protein